MRINSFVKKNLKIFLSLVYKNYQGQVAIFVALIFQIVFILFALLINVGLLVHHKINLQQSTDLAAYYGAMKQAEILNVIGHVNFQMRQAFKLLTWRYRILGTFGNEKINRPDNDPKNPNIIFPISRQSPPDPLYQYNPRSENFYCPGFDSKGNKVNIYPTQLPFMCMIHVGFADYPYNSVVPNAVDNEETFCKMDCQQLLSAKFANIPQLKPINTTSSIFTDSIMNTMNNTLINVDNTLNEICKQAGPIAAINLAKFYTSYLQDIKNKMLFNKVLFADLSADEKEMLDIEGGSIYDGTYSTLIKNLTEANNSSLNSNDNVFETFNSLSKANGGDCNYSQATNDLNKPNTNRTRLFNEINFQFIQYFLMKCDVVNGAKQYSASSIYDEKGEFDPNLYDQIVIKYKDKKLADAIKSIMNMRQHTIGIEKNPWCPVYYGVKTSTTPIIPFLPISKVKLHAISFAKPFGGSIGPKIFNKWSVNDSKSDSSTGDSGRIDSNLPFIPFKTKDTPTINSLEDQKEMLLNFSRYVGDKMGLSDPKYVAIYHDMLRTRSVAGNTSQIETSASSSKTLEPQAGKNFHPDVWPAYGEWNHLGEQITSGKYDSLALDNRSSTPANTYMRDIELSVVAPNQFDLAYYSIEPDFYNVYLKNKLEKHEVLDKLKSLAGVSGATLVAPLDYGHTKTKINGIPETFSVLKQLEVVQHIFRKASSSSPPTATTVSLSGGIHAYGLGALSSFYFTEIPYLPGSLLTGWTLKDFVSDDYSQVPTSDTKTPFAICADEGLHGSNGYGSITENKSGSNSLPPAPGNCITGGRTGYSVKIVNPKSFKESVSLGGESTQGTILNPPDQFMSFSN